MCKQVKIMVKRGFNILDQKFKNDINNIVATRPLQATEGSVRYIVDSLLPLQFLAAMPIRRRSLLRTPLTIFGSLLADKCLQFELMPECSLH